MKSRNVVWATVATVAILATFIFAVNWEPPSWHISPQVFFMSLMGSVLAIWMVAVLTEEWRWRRRSPRRRSSVRK